MANSPAGEGEGGGDAGEIEMRCGGGIAGRRSSPLCVPPLFLRMGGVYRILTSGPAETVRPAGQLVLVCLTWSAAAAHIGFKYTVFESWIRKPVTFLPIRQIVHRFTVYFFFLLDPWFNCRFYPFTLVLWRRRSTVNRPPPNGTPRHLLVDSRACLSLLLHLDLLLSAHTAASPFPPATSLARACTAPRTLTMDGELLLARPMPPCLTPWCLSLVLFQHGATPPTAVGHIDPI
jgi:hypothetical protein